MFGLKSDFWQTEIKEGDTHKTAFTCHLGFSEFNTMPFGLASAPSAFSSLMDNVLMGLLLLPIPCATLMTLLSSQKHLKNMSHL